MGILLFLAAVFIALAKVVHGFSDIIASDQEVLGNGLEILSLVRKDNQLTVVIGKYYTALAHEFVLLLDDRIFAPDAKGLIGNEVVELRNATTFIYVGQGERKGEWATATIEREDTATGFLRISGVFSSPSIGGEYHVNLVEGDQHSLRRLEETEEMKDLAVPAPDRGPRPRLAPINDILAVSDTSSDNAFYPGCYPGDTAPLIVKVNVATDAGFFEKVNAASVGLSLDQQQALVLQHVERAFSAVRPLYMAQLNVQLQIGQVVIGTPDSSVGVLRQNPRVEACPDVMSTLRAFSDWSRTASGAAHWHLFTDCYPSGVIGAGYIGGLCSNFGGHVALSSLNSMFWLTVAHEIGHVFGASHTFFRRQGGIMDYGNGRLNGGAVQFHLMNREEICAELSDAINRKCRFVELSPSSAAVCGNGMLEPTEECECTTSGGVTDCGDCQQCKLTRRDRQCVTPADGFIMRLPDTPSHVSTTDTELVAHPDCCQAGKLGTRSCENGRDVCSPTGACKKACFTFLLTPCGFDESGCIQQCMKDNRCYGIELATMGPPPVPAGAVPDGLTCKTLQGTPGTCRRGVCQLPSSTTSSPTLPDLSATLTRVPSSSPTRTSAPSLTDAPSLAPVASSPTQSPVALTCPNPRLFSTCPVQANPTKCQQAKCIWCPQSKSCQAVPIACEVGKDDLRRIYSHCSPFKQATARPSARRRNQGRSRSNGRS